MVEATEGSNPSTEKETEKDSKKVKSLLSLGQLLFLYDAVSRQLSAGMVAENRWLGASFVGERWLVSHREPLTS